MSIELIAVKEEALQSASEAVRNSFCDVAKRIVIFGIPCWMTHRSTEPSLVQLGTPEQEANDEIEKFVSGISNNPNACFRLELNVQIA